MIGWKVAWCTVKLQKGPQKHPGHPLKIGEYRPVMDDQLFRERYVPGDRDRSPMMWNLFPNTCAMAAQADGRIIVLL
jgi:hypothetical protein